MDQDFGKRLEKARLDRDLSIEQAAAAVRIRGTFLRALEHGDLTKFPNAAYAKSFLLMYSRFLGVDLKSVAAEIDTTTQMKVEGYQYLTSRAAELPRSKQEPEPAFSMAPTPKSSGSWLPLVVLAGLALVAFAAVSFWSNLNRLDDSQKEPPGPATPQPGDSAAVQSLSQTPAPAPPPEPAPPRPVIISLPARDATAPVPATAEPAAETAIPKARPISPVARIAATDAAALADLTIATAADPAAQDSNAIVLAPRRKTWVVIRNAAGGQKLYEDYLYPNAKPMRLPAGRYFIELRDADGVEISRNGKRIAYAAPGVAIE